MGYLSQNKYAKEMFKKFGMEDSRLVSIPMIICCKLSKLDDSPYANQTTYRSIIGILMHLIASRSDIMQAICMVARF